MYFSSSTASFTSLFHWALFFILTINVTLVTFHKIIFFIWFLLSTVHSFCLLIHVHTCTFYSWTSFIFTLGFFSHIFSSMSVLWCISDCIRMNHDDAIRFIRTLLFFTIYCSTHNGALLAIDSCLLVGESNLLLISRCCW